MRFAQDKLRRRAAGELHGLGLSWADEFLCLVGAYVELQREPLADSTDTMENRRDIDIHKPE